MIALILLPLISSLTLQKQYHQSFSLQEALVPETNLSTLLSASMGLRLPQAPSEMVRATYSRIIRDCLPDYDTVYLGIYINDVEPTIRIKHVQTSVAGHEEHMNNAGPAVLLMVNASEGVVTLGSDLAGPENLLNDPILNALLDKMPGRRDYARINGKRHRFSNMNHKKAANSTFVLLDRFIMLPSSLSSEIVQIIDQFVATAELTPMLAGFDVFYRRSLNTLAFREIYQHGESVMKFRESTRTFWRVLSGMKGSVIKQEVAGPSDEIKALKNWWNNADEGTVEFFTLYDGFQRVQRQD